MIGVDPKPCPQCSSLQCGPIRCRFTMRDHLQPPPAEAVASEPSYWDEKVKDRREEFLEQEDIDRQRAYPDREPR